MGDHKGGGGRGNQRGAFVGAETMDGMPNVPSLRQLETDPRAARGIQRTVSADEQLQTRHADMLDAGGSGRIYVDAYKATYARPSRKVNIKPVTGKVTEFDQWKPAERANYYALRGHRAALNDLHDMLINDAGYPF